MKYQITIPKPCHENWDKMTSTEKGKFCNSCSKEVIDFTKISVTDISKKVLNEKNLCGRFKATQINKKIETTKKNHLSKVAAGLALISTITASEAVFSQTQKDSTEVITLKMGKMLIDKDSIQKEIVINGKVKDKNEFLPGASILLKGTHIGTQSDFDGKFSIKIPNKKAKSTILVISYLGFKTQEIDILSIKKPLIVEMQQDDTAILGEFVTVGMIAVKRPSIFKRIGNLFRKKENRRY